MNFLVVILLTCLTVAWVSGAILVLLVTINYVKDFFREDEK